MSEVMLQKLAEQFGLALDFSKENVIPYLQQLAERVVKYETCQSIFWLVFGTILLLVGIVMIVLAIKNVITWDEDTIIGFIIVGFVLGLIGSFVVCQQISDLILCKYLPEKILLRYVNG